MANNNYTIKYSTIFINEFNSILKYFVSNLKNKIVAENFYNEVVRKIERRSHKPEGYEKYTGDKKRKNTYYRIYVKNYTVFYTVNNGVMEIRRILYNRRNIDKL